MCWQRIEAMKLRGIVVGWALPGKDLIKVGKELRVGRAKRKRGKVGESQMGVLGSSFARAQLLSKG